jgi:hypothetical protein
LSLFACLLFLALPGAVNGALGGLPPLPDFRPYVLLALQDRGGSVGEKGRHHKQHHGSTNKSGDQDLDYRRPSLRHGGSPLVSFEFYYPKHRTWGGVGPFWGVLGLVAGVMMHRCAFCARPSAYGRVCR